jgi:hypothetical protein
MKNISASRSKIEWNLYSELFRKVENAHKAFKADVINSVNTMNLSKSEYRTEFVNCVNRNLISVARSGEVKDFEGCKYVLSTIKYLKKKYSKECRDLKREFRISNRSYNCRF